MGFVSVLALAVAFFVAAPYVAHRLRRRRAEERRFAPARLVGAAPPTTRHRAKLEHRTLFAARALAILLLALLGASPFVRCSRLSLQRSSGASIAVAIVLDDSMSMRAKEGTARVSRFEEAKRGADELLGSLRDGDAIAIILAGAPARVALAATTDIQAAKKTIAGLGESDRATDLDGAFALARDLVGSLPQVDRRVVLFSDLFEESNAAPLGEGANVPLWAPLTETWGAFADCAVISAERTGAKIRVKVGCSSGAAAQGREASIVDESQRVLAKHELPETTASDLTLTLDSEPKGSLTLKLSGRDAIAADDVAPVVLEAAPSWIAVIAEANEESVATGGAPIVEQALSALNSGIAVRPIPHFPERAEDLGGSMGVILDDPPGLTPEQRRAVSDYFDAGGSILLTLGPRAAAAPLGASLEPILAHAVGWQPTSVVGADVQSGKGPFTDLAASLDAIHAQKRATLDSADAQSFEQLLRWTDKAPFIGSKMIGRGEAWFITLPFSPEWSDFPLRPGFLGTLDAWTEALRTHASPRRTNVGVAWTFPSAKRVQIRGPLGPLSTSAVAGSVRAEPPVLGAYQVEIDGHSETRVATAAASELTTKKRTVTTSQTTSAGGESRTAVDLSSQIAVLLLVCVAAEVALRLYANRDAA